MILGIDPGKNGGAALVSDSGDLIAVHPFRSPEDMDYKLREWSSHDIHTIMMERVHAFPGQGVVSAFSFGQNLGWWEGRLCGFSSAVHYVEPRTWQQKLCTKLPGHKQKAEHKRALLAVARSMFPDTKITLGTCDAVLIAATALSVLAGGASSTKR
jgi:hypothetical protein